MDSRIDILFIDSYDSFTYNVVRLLEQQGPITVTTIHNDTFASLDGLLPLLSLFDCIVVGPGPGNPRNGCKDIGIIEELFRSDVAANVPILGICLGFQAMCYSRLGPERIQELDIIKHGQVYDIELSSKGVSSALFKGYPEQFKSTRYHSLHVLMDNASIEEGVCPLAITHDENGELLMAAQVGDLPWYGVQYHPESCCSQFGGLLIQNFLGIAHDWNHNRTQRYQCKLGSRVRMATQLEQLAETIDRTPIFVKSRLALPSPGSQDICIREYQDPKYKDCAQVTLKLADKIKGDKFILASSNISANRGEWSIIALPNENSQVFTHYESLGKTTVHGWQADGLTHESLHQNLTKGTNTPLLQVIGQDKTQFWGTLGQFMEPRLQCNFRTDLPFVGGLVGILGYEMGLYVKKPTLELEGAPTPDAKLVYIENSILVDHLQGRIFLISVGSDGSSCFPDDIADIFADSSWVDEDLAWPQELPEKVTYDVKMPDKSQYGEAFRKCQEYMHRGDSYEICLTTQTLVTPSTPTVDPWRIFQVLVQRNPAPFASFFQFNDLCSDAGLPVPQLCLISSSPERFLKWDNDTCELRPIKGTVRKSPQMDRARATEILKTPKEFGENLMILDLIRNDLYELLPDVRVEEFMTVEEYATVYQLVSVVKAYGLSQSAYSGLDILHHSLPVWVHDGGPKKITVQLLQDELEQHLNGSTAPGPGQRGVYSGVTGYWSLNGSGDWSVNIRCMYTHDGGAHWRLGAGGAITVLSTEQGELDEMYTKLESALQVFPTEG
ncbi:4-amino-4-deoxychorismate synthase KNAG_0D00360 [Huiozyma naganishii CBS 8797]|uniref:aminodeoxychorismate synthase n=1 Tax=Huiozyma naganishii (strain ATCC MYA-139 / BCRC 22969 / CBS 8797 / KCTC 17520 / NBRC 10181 / NCYC 3082 / Yp74L-3) TaxID=1071383 RepID=J7S5D2_HUIN7|nr:hypothetical protein KNAG_0D00360 [Kazachstania naganishii CBS 8797]CCK69789.1 hypothetical protein KNAG_0D00360 [Kazachstania naganishii CBS 8797]